MQQTSQRFSYMINEKEISIFCLAKPIHLHTSSLQWLEQQALYPKVFWKSKFETHTTLALGSLMSFSDLPTITCTHQEYPFPLKCFGAFSFCHHPIAWEGFSLPRFFLPRIFLTLDQNQEGTLYYYYLKEEEKNSLQELLKEQKKQPLPTYFSSFLERQDLPNQDTWCHIVEKALHAFETTPLKKVVLARQTQLSFAQVLSPLSIMEHLSTLAINCTLFAYLPNSSLSFIGASPEHLYKRTGNTLFTEAVAGTRKRGKTKEEDFSLIQELRENEKEQREFAYVDSFLEETLSKLRVTLTKKASPSIIQTPSLQHLYHLFEGVLPSSLTDKELLSTLHPTPAVGGTPRCLAETFLHQHELFTRGLYAAPLGWISPYSAEYIVAIRSALIKKNCMTLFAGAGIVKDCDPLREWEELELKISPFLNANYAYIAT
jgi:menaquinone-specific isochorismate synthase